LVNGENHISSCYQAHLPSIPPGHLLTQYFLASSKNKMPSPNAAGKKKCSAGTCDVLSVFCKAGIYSQKIAITSAKPTAGKR